MTRNIRAVPQRSFASLSRVSDEQLSVMRGELLGELARVVPERRHLAEKRNGYTDVMGEILRRHT